MVTLITILISLLGYGDQADYQNWTESEVQHEIVLVEQHIADGGSGATWDSE